MRYLMEVRFVYLFIYFGHSLETFAAKCTGIHSRASFWRIYPQLGNLYQVSPYEF